MRSKLIAGNWKMNGSRAQNEDLLNALKTATLTSQTNLAIFPPAPYLMQCQSILSGSKIQYGAQDISVQQNGAYTGEWSGAMLADCGCQMVIVGHSERRTYHNESSSYVAEKTATALANGLRPIVCVGESAQQRQDNQTKATIEAQLLPVLTRCPKDAWSKIIVAYEPIWAIGSGVAANPEDAEDVHQFIRDLITNKVNQAQETLILYGGSVKANNAQTFFAMPNIDGALVGGASLQAHDFLMIAQAAARAQESTN